MASLQWCVLWIVVAKVPPVISGIGITGFMSELIDFLWEKSGWNCVVIASFHCCITLAIPSGLGQPGVCWEWQYCCRGRPVCSSCPILQLDHESLWFCLLVFFQKLDLRPMQSQATFMYRPQPGPPEVPNLDRSSRLHTGHVQCIQNCCRGCLDAGRIAFLCFTFGCITGSMTELGGAFSPSLFFLWQKLPYAHRKLYRRCSNWRKSSTM